MSRATPPLQLWNALVRTHHITSRKKVGKLRQAADEHEVYALICYGGCPGIMYTEGSPEGVKQWVDSVHRLRYKDYQLAVRPAPVAPEVRSHEEHARERAIPVGLHEVETVKDFGAVMRERGVWSWWRRGMGYASGHE
ncbi:hypothetical protein DAEQUDRAFT_666803 [Daedalea quercina L-15889]|uniref:Uncharacterized protein n=1 Tax=Daedalea quercina L-15889 TaxID=1314783 RepID=A0A165RLM1_9APHY|nr:hypothetical protein DAEQUDRAFT_666803 [Daedalea quercina L-15889]